MFTLPCGRINGVAQGGRQWQWQVVVYSWKSAVKKELIIAIGISENNIAENKVFLKNALEKIL